MPPSLPALVTVKVPPRSSSGFKVPARAASARRAVSAASSSSVRGVAASDDRYDEPLLGLDGDPEVVALEIDELVALESSVQLWVLLQRRRGRLQHERHEPAEVDVGEVALLHERDRRNLLVRARESLDDLTPDPADGLPAPFERLVLFRHKLLSTGAADIGLDDPPVRPGAAQRSQIHA